ncbi:MAG: hypothetical protein DMD78_26640 [Candidatus Rokuibacteriota bacterium]|nr:MAG: hypothetical protein DMD78_26640 [Candidatus Rokubacteria bacterium]
MHRPRFATRLSTAALVVFVAGCTGHRAASLAAGPVATAFTQASGLAGTWNGSFTWVGAYFYIDDARMAVRIEDDGRFTATVTPAGGTNNLAKPSRLAGTVVPRGDLVTLRNEEGPWPWITLARSGDTLYGVAVDPATQANVMMKLVHDDSWPSASGPGRGPGR